jgi:hypothetical protein
MEYKSKIEGLVTDYFTTINTRETKTFSEKKDYENELRGLFMRSDLDVEVHPSIEIQSGSILIIRTDVSNGVEYLNHSVTLLNAEWIPIQTNWES